VQRAELGERRAAIRAALLQLRNAKLLPFSPTLLVGYSAGTFGGGSNLADQPRFDSFNSREDLDVLMYWSLRNLGVGNVALIRVSQSQYRQSELQALATLDRVRAEVAAAQARIIARFDQIAINEKAIDSSQNAFKSDFQRARNAEGLPIEVLDSLRLMARSRQAYLDAIVDYNIAQFELYVALGQPPADTLAHPVRIRLGAPIAAPEKK
jgi:outer membrane protein TolC